MTHKEFIEQTNFIEVQKEYWNQFSIEFKKNSKIIAFKDFDPEIYLLYQTNRLTIVESYFLEFSNDLKRESFNWDYYNSLMALEETFDQSEASFFSEYFLEFIKNVNVALSNNFYSEDLLDFIWSTFDRIFHEAFHLENETRDLYKLEIRKLKQQVLEIDKEDEHLILQKIDQFFGKNI
ncbi:hypothetical protein EYY60_09150 [Flavobacterium zhairuonense]|uniref:hypothetical protein n=1 Tax=Flavobacterium zhairuonense TaxID=2493631 RepID=UPI00104E7122|nr:hypothetical protein [Flavobacterium zhairuonense]KAF2510672.1 hypothetical protein EYY60_09150 [Flavobacterium zhairuonense]